MPAIKSAKKKLRQDKKRQTRNKEVKDTYKKALKTARTNPTSETLRVAAKLADKAAKNHIIHKNKASRIKSFLSHLLPKTPKRSSSK